MLKRFRYLIRAVLATVALLTAVPSYLLAALSHVVTGHWGDAREGLAEVFDIPDTLVYVWADVWYGGVR